MMRTGFFLTFVLALLGANALAQNIDVLKGDAPVQNGVARHHMSAMGKLCLTIRGYAKPEVVNKNIYQHLITAANECNQTIRVQVCYYGTQNCIDMSVPPYDHKDSILGIFPALKRFQFEAKEQF
jgi:hypothetical protein